MRNYQVIESDIDKIKLPVIWSDLHESLELSTKDGIRKSLNVEAVKTSIDNILRTYPGERVMRPTFGSPMQDLLFENINPSNATAIATEIRSVINRWDRRVNVNAIDFKADPDRNMIYLYMSFSIVGDDRIHSQRVELSGGV